jgi:hypothetical protein
LIVAGASASDAVSRSRCRLRFGFRHLTRRNPLDLRPAGDGSAPLARVDATSDPVAALWGIPGADPRRTLLAVLVQGEVTAAAAGDIEAATVAHDAGPANPRRFVHARQHRIRHRLPRTSIGLTTARCSSLLSRGGRLASPSRPGEARPIHPPKRVRFAISHRSERVAALALLRNLHVVCFSLCPPNRPHGLPRHLKVCPRSA